VETGVFVETDSFNFTDGTGAGQDRAGAPILLSGVSLHASGSAEQEPLQVGAATNPSGATGDQEISVGAGDVQVSAPSKPAQAGTGP
jgi:hypothetical protein